MSAVDRAGDDPAAEGAVDFDALAGAVAPYLERRNVEVESGRARPASRPDVAAEGTTDRSADPARSRGGVALALSDQARALLGADQGEAASGASRSGESESQSSGDEGAAPGQALGARDLSREEQEEVRELQARDREVRAHENAHKAAAGRHARGGPRFEFEQGPDGRRYAVGGEVSIDTSAVPNDPDATIQKMQQVRRAALAPAEPSPQDRRVASEASRTESQARADQLETRREERAEEPQLTPSGGTAEAPSGGSAEAPSRGTAEAPSRGSAYAPAGSDRRGGALDLVA